MAKPVPYSKQTLDSPNPITRFAHRARHKVSLAAANRLLPANGSMIDFGAGTGIFLEEFRKIRPDARRVAIEPYMTIPYPDIRRVAGFDELPPQSFDLVTTFEVLEHVSDADLAAFLRDARTALKPGGKLLVTVPIMYGLMLPVKELSRSLLHRRLGDTGPVEMLRATFGTPISRPGDRLPTHKGFDFRWLEQEISKSYRIIERSFSPFPALPWWLNSQAFFVAE